MTIDGIIFIVSTFFALFGALMMFFQKNPVASVLYFILSLVAQAVLYVQLGGLFISAILIIVYSGAILVLFLFVIMILNLRGDEDLGKPSPPVSNVTKVLVGVGLLAEFVFIIKTTVFTRSVTTGVIGIEATDFGSAEQVAGLLFTRFLYPFELTSILLLAAIVGAVIMARRVKGEDEAEKPNVNSKPQTTSEIKVDEALK